MDFKIWDLSAWVSLQLESIAIGSNKQELCFLTSESADITLGHSIEINDQGT